MIDVRKVLTDRGIKPEELPPGEFSLVRMKKGTGKEWLLIKKKDAYQLQIAS